MYRVSKNKPPLNHSLIRVWLLQSAGLVFYERGGSGGGSSFLSAAAAAAKELITARLERDELRRRRQGKLCEERRANGRREWWPARTRLVDSAAGIVVWNSKPTWGHGPSLELSFAETPQPRPARVGSHCGIGRASATTAAAATTTATSSSLHLPLFLLLPSPPPCFFHPRGKEISLSRASWARGGFAGGARTHFGCLPANGGEDKKEKKKE